MSKKTSKSVYQITLTNWHKRNPKHKDWHKYSLIPHNFCTDPKLLELTVSARWMYVGLVLLCGAEGKDTVRCGEAFLKLHCSSGRAPIEVLSELQQFQLLTTTKTPLLNELNNQITKGNEVFQNPENQADENSSKFEQPEKVAPQKQQTETPENHEPISKFENISNSTELQNISLKFQKQIDEIETLLSGKNTFGENFPTFWKRGKNNFCGRILVAYEFSIEDFTKDLTAVINETLIDKIAPSTKTSYIVTRLKKKALEMINASR